MLEYFVPPKISKSNLNSTYFEGNKIINYAPLGRVAILKICKEYHKPNTKIILPVYICESVKKILIENSFILEYCDINIDDLNPCIDSISKIINENEISIVIVPSMYGNAADLINIYKLCLKNNIKMIDDAAQSAGAILDNRLLGNFGDAGLIAFSPGKNSAGAMGSYYWIREKKITLSTNGTFFHYIIWLDFYFNRYNVYIYKNYFKILSRVKNLFINSKYFLNSNISKFEIPILNGILNNILNGKYNFRKFYYNHFFTLFNNNETFNIVQSKRGISHPGKIVLIFKNLEAKNRLIKILDTCNIKFGLGYDLNNLDKFKFPNANKVANCVLELPIEDSEERMHYLFKIINKFLEN